MKTENRSWIQSKNLQKRSKTKKTVVHTIGNLKKLKTTATRNPIPENTVKPNVFQWFLQSRSPPRGARGTSRDPLGRPGDPQARPSKPSGILFNPQGPPKGALGPLRDPLRDKKGSRIRSEIEKAVVSTIENQKIQKQRPQGTPSVLLIAENTRKKMFFNVFHIPRGTSREPPRSPDSRWGPSRVEPNRAREYARDENIPRKNWIKQKKQLKTTKRS